MQFPQRRPSLNFEINVTPFVDVMFFLLVIFMVTAPLMVEGVDVDLPNVEAPAIATEGERLMVTVNPDRTVQINEYTVDLETLGPKLAAIYRNRNQDEGILLRADQSIPYGYIMKVMGLIRGAGIFKIGLVTEPIEGFTTPESQ